MKTFRVTFERIIRTLCKTATKLVEHRLPSGKSNSQNSPVPGDNITSPFLRCDSFWLTLTLANPEHVCLITSWCRLCLILYPRDQNQWPSYCRQPLLTLWEGNFLIASLSMKFSVDFRPLWPKPYETFTIGDMKILIKCVIILKIVSLIIYILLVIMHALCHAFITIWL